jgi:hypothetical protein
MAAADRGGGAHIAAVAELEARDDLQEEAERRLLADCLALAHVVEQTAALGELLNKIDLFGQGDDVVQVDDGGVVLEALEDADLARGTLPVVRALDGGLRSEGERA